MPQLNYKMALFDYCLSSTENCIVQLKESLSNIKTLKKLFTSTKQCTSIILYKAEYNKITHFIFKKKKKSLSTSVVGKSD